MLDTELGLSLHHPPASQHWTEKDFDIESISDTESCYSVESVPKNQSQEVNFHDAVEYEEPVYFQGKGSSSRYVRPRARSWHG
jgi:hypothetical protein